MSEPPADLPPGAVFYSAEEVGEIYDRRLKLSKDLWGAASAYDTAITVAGYGAFFALWKGVAADIPPKARGLCVGLMGLSLLLYILWSVAGMVVRHRLDMQFVAAIRKHQSAIDAINEWDSLERKRDRTLLIFQQWLWLPVFGTSLATGTTGGLLLAYNSFGLAFHWPLFPR